MPELTDFLLARIAEDEAAALRSSYPAKWAPGDPTAFPDPGWWWPQRVLAECDAKRRIVEQYEGAFDARRALPDDLALAGAILALHGAVKALALPYAAHPDYREEWKP